MRKLDPKTRDQLIEQARKLANEREWNWLEPVEVTASAEGGEPVWIVLTNVPMRGQNVRIVIRQSDHAVVNAGYLPR